MSQTLSTTAMVTRVQRKTGIGLPNQDCMDFLNEAFRAIDQMSKGGFIWQLRTANLTVPFVEALVPLPSDFDAGKTALLRGTGTSTPVQTVIPYKPMKEFVNQSHFQTTGVGVFAVWTMQPNFSVPTNYAWNMKLGPSAAFGTGLGPPWTLPFWYHAVNLAPFAIGTGNYFPTPDQFDSLIVDLAVAELAQIHRLSDSQGLRAKAMEGIASLIDTYRTDRYDLAGLTDNAMQSQEKSTEKSK